MNEYFIIRKDDFTLQSVKGHHIIMHISDSHLCLYDNLSPEDEKRHSIKRESDWNNFKHGFANAFGDTITADNDVSTLESFDRLIEYAKETKPELLVISGDTLEYMHGAGERHLREKLKEYGRPFICTPGNHETKVLSEIWSEHPSVYRGDGFTFVGIDNREKTVSEKSLDILTDLTGEGIPLFTVFHIPVVTDNNRDAMKRFDPYYLMDEKTDDINASRFVSLLKSSDTIKAVFCGHVHGYHRSEIALGKMQICSSSSMIGNIHIIDIHGETD